VKTSFDFKGYKALLCSVDNKLNKIIINVFVLKSLYFEKKNKLIFNNIKNKSIFNYFLEKLLKIKYLYLLLNKIFYFYLLLMRNIGISFTFLYIYTFIFINYFTSLTFNLISDNSIKISSYRLKSIKKDFFSVYRLKWFSKDIEYLLTKLTKKKVSVKCSLIYSLFKYSIIGRFINFNLNIIKFWMVKRNFKFFESIYFSCYFYLSDVMVNIIIENLSRKKKTHFRFIYFFFGYIELLHYQSVLNISGIKISIFGKLNARMRKQRVVKLLGKV
jgi:hypothetical protein